ncbi:transport and Golgi organization protein 6 homolog [Achroia grisella]|uniref:transport and Golgi organization protein 6 homolog n=1 Tax=Achroia grisella TaxID=688607 RepID=UPI0027D32BA6|nr:transport and Golgi organization protein 6 homolog [Achroia grisella]
MMTVDNIFENLNKLTHEDGQREYLAVLFTHVNEETNGIIDNQKNSYDRQRVFIQKIMKEIDDLSKEVIRDDTILISVKNQKLLRTSYQLVTSLGITPSLIPGLGINLSKRCTSSTMLPRLLLNDEQKYEMLTECANFFSRSYKIPVLKSIIISLHLSDYLAALIQLAFAPLKKPGTYTNFAMTEDRYKTLMIDRQKYVQIYEHLVYNCFQPTLMKELLVLQSVKDPAPPTFIRKIIAKEMSRRLLVPGGLLSLIRCFIESYSIDTGFEWKKVDMISKIVTSKHGSGTEENYLDNICNQIMQILSLNNTHYIRTATACALSLKQKYPESIQVNILIKEIFNVFDYDYLVSKSNLPGTILLSSQEIEHKVNVLYASLCTTRLDCSSSLLLPNLYVLFLLGINNTKNEELAVKLKDIILKSLEQLNKNEIILLIQKFLFGKNDALILIEEYDAGLVLKYVTSQKEYPKEDTIIYFLNILKASSEDRFVQCVFEISLELLIEINLKRQTKPNQDLLSLEDDVILLDNIDAKYSIVLQLLSEISTLPKIISSLKTNPVVVLHFIEHFIVENQDSSNDECITIALILLNTILSNSNKTKELDKTLNGLIPVLKAMSVKTASYNNILCEEAISLLTSKDVIKSETEFGKAMTDVFDDLLPVRTHGVIALTKLIEANDPETISKKYYLFCLFQEYLKDSDSYVYLYAINGIASLGTYCTEDVLHVLCREFLEISCDNNLQDKANQNKVAEMRMKIGDIIVKVIKKLGDMAIVYKTLLLNTVLCGCRDDDPLIRTSALSNLAEIALMLHYKIGSIIYEVLHCIWCILETDKAVECRRAAVMVIGSLLKGLGKEVLIELKETLLPIYRTLKSLYRDNNEDQVLRLHAQLALEELNDIVKEFLFPEVKLNKKIFVLDSNT